ncbi:MAG: FAD-dependent oxidoreductase [Candidatus Omnitrophota bacterium]
MKTKEIYSDVLVVGAGISGIAAAISASRSGGKTILIEKNSSPGGIAISDQHRYICGLYPKNTGIAREIIGGLQKLSPENQFIRMGKLSAFYYRPESLKLVLHKLLRQENNLKVFYNCKIIKVKKNKNSIVSLEATKNLGSVQNQEPNLKFAPRVVIDASGQGNVIKLSKAKYLLTPLASRQLSGFTFQLRGLRNASDLLAIKVPYYLSLAVKQKRLPAYFKFTNFAYGATKNSGIIKVNLPPKNTPRGKQVVKKITALVHAYLRKTLPEFKNTRLGWVSSGIHEREGLRLYGGHILTEQNVLSARKFPDAIAKGYWPIEFWHPLKGPQIKYLKTGEFYEIPLRCLKSKNIVNLLATGKCISATSVALASSRVTGTCIYLGEAAGRAAGLAGEKRGAR